MTETRHMMPDSGGALRQQMDVRIPVPIYGDRMMLMTPEAARALRDWLVANVPDGPFGGGE